MSELLSERAELVETFTTINAQARAALGDAFKDVTVMLKLDESIGKPTLVVSIWMKDQMGQHEVSEIEDSNIEQRARLLFRRGLDNLQAIRQQQGRA